METTRILLRHRDVLYRLLRIEARPDGSLVFLIDRDPSPRQQSHTLRGGLVQRDTTKEGQVTPKGKFTCHVTGQINRHSYGEFQGKHFIEPLYSLTKSSLVGFYSIPNPRRLDLYKKGKKRNTRNSRNTFRDR